MVLLLWIKVEPWQQCGLVSWTQSSLSVLSECTGWVTKAFQAARCMDNRSSGLFRQPEDSRRWRLLL